MNLQKKDLYYIIGILIAVIICILSVRLSDNTSVVDYFGFAGNLVGIVLAIVALIYSFYQNVVYGSVNQKLEQSAKQIEDATYKLNNLENIELTMSNLHTSTSQLENKIESTMGSIYTGYEQLAYTIDQINLKFDDSFNEVNTGIYSLHSLIEEKNIFPSQEKLEPQLNVDVINTLVFSFSASTILLLYSLIRSRLLGQKTNLYSQVKWTIKCDIGFLPEIWNHKDATEKMKLAVIERNLGVLSQTLTILNNIGSMSLEGEIFDVEAIMAIELEDAILNRMTEYNLVDVYKFTDEVITENNNDEERIDYSK